jgi:hypothetical protein
LQFHSNLFQNGVNVSGIPFACPGKGKSLFKAAHTALSLVPCRHVNPNPRCTLLPDA